MLLDDLSLGLGIGILAALPAAYGVGRPVSSQLYGVSAADPAILAGGAIVLAES